MALDLNTELLKFKRIKNQLAAEEVRTAMDPGSLIVDLYNYRDEYLSAEPSAFPRIDRQINVTLNLLKKCMPDLKAVEFKGVLGLGEIKSFNDMYEEDEDADA